MEIPADYELVTEQTKNGDKDVCRFEMRCPYCGEVYVRDNYFGTDLTRETIDAHYTRYGSPLRTCGACGKEFLDRSMRELALEKVPVRSVLTRLRRSGLVMLIVGTLAAIFFLFADFEAAGLLGIIAVGVAVAGIVRLLTHPQGLKSQKELRVELTESEKRTADADYMNRLREYKIIE